MRVWLAAFAAITVVTALGPMPAKAQQSVTAAQSNLDEDPQDEP